MPQKKFYNKDISIMGRKPHRNKQGLLKIPNFFALGWNHINPGRDS
jgi:hypothetical protein